jgi:hypothetical protein
MTDLRLAGRAGALLIPIALVIAACTGAASSSAPSVVPGSSTGPGTGPSAAPTTPATSQAPAPTDGGQPSGAIAVPSFDIGLLTAGLAKLDSYRVSITIGGVEQYKGIIVTKPVLSRDLTVPGNTRIVVIGDEAWIGKVGGPLTASPSSMATQLFAAYDPTLMVAMFSGAGWAESSIDKGTEEKNGVSTKHYRIDGTTLAAGFTGLPAGATIDVWIAEDKDYLVASEVTGFPNGDMSIQVTGVDDPANKIERPS